MALRLDTTARAGDATLPVAGAYLQARPLVMDKDDDGVWYLVAELRWWTASPDDDGKRLRADPERVKLSVDPDAIAGNPIEALYARLKAEPGFESAEDA